MAASRAEVLNIRKFKKKLKEAKEGAPAATVVMDSCPKEPPGLGVETLALKLAEHVVLSRAFDYVFFDLEYFADDNDAVSKLKVSLSRALNQIAMEQEKKGEKK